MGRVFRRVLSFLLGFIVGIGSVAGTLVGAAYWAYKKVSLEKIGAEMDGLGDFNSMTIEQTVDTALDLFKNPQNYSIKDLEQEYNFDLKEFLGAFGLELKDESADEKANVEALKNMNLAYLFAGGMDNFLDSINTRVIFNFIPDSLLSNGTRARLSQYTLRELFSKDEITGRMGIFDALGQVKFGGVFPEYFDEKYNPNAHVYTYEYIVNGENQDKQWLSLLGNLNFGSLLNSFVTGDSDILTELMSGRLTDISDRPIREVFGDIGGIFSDDIGEKLKQYIGIFGDASITDWFILSKDGESYSFSIENVLQKVKLGYLFGFEEKEGEWYDGDKLAGGVKKIIADVDVYKLYLAYEDGTLPETLVDEVGDLSIGTLLEEFMDYTRVENPDENATKKYIWSSDDGKPLNILTAFADVSVGSILGGTGSLMENVLNAIRESASGYSLGDFASDFMDIEQNAEGKWVKTDGEEVLGVLGGLFSIEVNDLIMDEFSVESFVSILKQAVGESSVGEILGYTKQGKDWYDGADKVSEMMSFISNIKARNVLDIFLTDYTPSQIVKAIFGDATIGEVLIAFAKFTYDEESGIFYNFKDEETVPALYTLKDVKLWELVAAFDKESAYDIFPVLYEIELGDFFGKYVEADGTTVLDGYWSLDNFMFNKPINIRGALNVILSLNVGKMCDPDLSASEVFEPVKDITIGEITQSALGLYRVSTELGIDWESEYGVKVFDFMKVFGGIPTSIQDIIDFASGDSGEDLEAFLTNMLGGVRIGDFIGDLLGLSYNANTGVWFSDDTSDKTYEIIEFLLNYVVINDTYAIINSKDKLATIAEMVEGLEIGHIAEPFMGIYKEIEWRRTDGDLKTILADLFGVDLSYIVTLIGDIIDGDDILVSDVIKNISGETRTLGEYLSDFIPEINFKPLEKNVYGIILYQFADIIFDGNSEKHSFENKREYLRYLFDDIKVGHFLEPIGALDLEEIDDTWVSREDNNKVHYRFFNALYNVKVFFIGEFIYDTISTGDFAYDRLYGEVFGKETTIGYYLAELFDHQFHEEKKVWTDADGYVLYSYLRVLYDRVPYAFLSDAKAQGFAQATRNWFGDIKVGDLLYDVIMEKLSVLDISAYKNLETGSFENYGKFVNLFNVIYNISVDEIFENLSDGGYWKDKFFALLVGDYISDFIKIAVEKIGFYTQISYDKETNSYFVTEEYNKVLTYLFNKSINDVYEGIRNNGFVAYLTENWFRDILIGDFLDHGLYHYDSASKLWYDKDKVVPFDFDLYSIVYKEVLGLSVYDLTHSFDYMILLDNLFLGNAMALTRYAEFTYGEQVIYMDAGMVYTLDSQGRQQEFPYEIYTDGEGNWFYYDGEYEFTLAIREYTWYGTKLFANANNVEINKNDDGTYTIIDNATGSNCPYEYIAVKDVYKVTIGDKVDYFRVYNGTIYQATEDGDFRRFYKNFIVQKLADVQLESIINGFDIEKMLGGYYVGEVMGNYKGNPLTKPEGDYREYEVYEWYKLEGVDGVFDQSTRLSAMEEVVANIKLQSIFDGKVNFSKEIENLKVIDVIPNARKVSILKLFADVEMKNLEARFDELYLGDIMEMTSYTSGYDTVMRAVLENENTNQHHHKIYGKYVYRSRLYDSENYIVDVYGNTVYVNSHYILNDGEVIYVDAYTDGTGKYYYEDPIDGEVYELETSTTIWVDTNDIELIDGYDVIDFKVYAADGTEMGEIIMTENGTYTTRKTGEITPIEGLEHLILRDDDPDPEVEDWRWFRSHANGEQLIEPADDLIAVFAKHTLDDFQSGTFLGDVIWDIKNSVYIGEFFKKPELAEGEVETGVLALFTQSDLDKILIEDFVEECTDRVKGSTIESLIQADIVKFGENDAKHNENVAKLTVLFQGESWKQLTINGLLSEMIGLIPATT